MCKYNVCRYCMILYINTKCLRHEPKQRFPPVNIPFPHNPVDIARFTLDPCIISRGFCNGFLSLLHICLSSHDGR